MIDLIEKYFQNLTDLQKKQFAMLQELYQDWNSKINVISRKDMDYLYLHHVLHSLAITQMITFKAGTKIIDVGCGGGFPGIPLAILMPDVNFLLIDSIRKKIKVTTAIAEAVGLKNVRAIQCRAEELKDEKCHFVVSRAAMQMKDLVHSSMHLVNTKDQFNALPNGIICLKGGNLTSELNPFKNKAIVEDIYPNFDEEYFKTKQVIYLPV